MPSPKGARYAAWSVLGQKRRTYRVMCTGPPAAAGAAAAAAAGAAAAAAAAGLAAAAALLSANSAVPAAPPHAPMLADMLEPGSRLLALARGGAARGALPRRTEAREPRTSGWPTWSSLGAAWREAKVRARARARVHVQGWLRAERAREAGPPPRRWSPALQTRASPPG